MSAKLVRATDGAAAALLRVAEERHPDLIVQRLVRHGQATVLVARSPAQRERQ